MFAQLKNQFKLTFNFKIDSPLCIRSGEESIDPTLPDMQCVRSYKNGENVVFIPGSSIKGVVRTQCEKIYNVIGNGKIACDIHDKSKVCNKSKDKDIKESGATIYSELCPACKMFGSMRLGGRIKFKDAYPIDNKFKIGYRNGVGINRITGAAQRGALYDFEVVEDASFKVTITGDNFELYQLKVLMWALDDINEGYSNFGSSSTRGNGKMTVEDMKLEIRDYRQENSEYLKGYKDKDIASKVNYTKAGYYNVCKIEGYDKIDELLENVDVADCIRRD